MTGSEKLTDGLSKFDAKIKKKIKKKNSLRKHLSLEAKDYKQRNAEG